MAYTTGKSKSLDDIKLDDVLEYPIWKWALDEEGEDGQDETWQKPIISTDNVTEEIHNPTITLRIKDSNLFAAAEIDYATQSLSAISVWLDDEWKALNQSKLKTPLVFIAIPKIDGVENVYFICGTLTDDNAERI